MNQEAIKEQEKEKLGQDKKYTDNKGANEGNPTKGGKYPKNKQNKRQI